MKYLLLALTIFVLQKSHAQTSTTDRHCDSIMRKIIDSTVKAKVDSIEAKKKKADKKEDKNVLDWLSNSGFSIRKGFSPSSKDDANPASAFWYKNFITNFSYTTVDVGAKYKGYEFGKRKSSFLIFPKMEWHKNEDTTSKSKNTCNTLTGGINIEYYYSVTPRFTPFIAGIADYKDDYIKKLETIDLSAYVSIFCIPSFLPGSLRVRDPKSDGLIFRYYPYTGIEYYRSTGASAQSTSFWASRLSVELNPLPKYLQFVFDYTYRVKISDNLYKQGDVFWLLVGVNHYFDAKHRLGIGLDYNEGSDPNNSFVRTNKIDLCFKLKV